MSNSAMGFWPWFGIWAGLVVASMVVFGLLGKSLFNKAASALHQGERIALKVEKLTAEIDKQVTVDKPSSSLNQDPAIAESRLRALKKVKNQKKQQRQRRLVASLRKFDPNESRFH